MVPANQCLPVCVRSALMFLMFSVALLVALGKTRKLQATYLEKITTLPERILYHLFYNFKW